MIQGVMDQVMMATLVSDPQTSTEIRVVGNRLPANAVIPTVILLTAVAYPSLAAHWVNRPGEVAITTKDCRMTDPVGCRQRRPT